MIDDNFISEKFLLGNAAAEDLYHNYAKEVPILDYHNHLIPADIANNRRYETITELWLEDDHYKWRAMRADGVAETYITGNASDKENF